MNVHAKLFLLCCLLLGNCAGASAKSITVASAANFKSTLELLASRFEDTTANQVTVITASSGVLYTQITYGAPFDVFLSADASRPVELENQNHTDSFVYAIGQLAFWLPRHSQVNREEFLRFEARIAIANPAIAPYGAAAMEVLQRLKPNHRKLVRGNNVNQVFQFVDTGNVAAGLLALSQLKQGHKSRYWVIPAELYSLIEQRGILLTKSTEAKLFVNYIQSSESRALISRAGYLLPVVNDETLNLNPTPEVP
ncbi:MAG: molybdate ABC transporter substrate-binding protein [bacterium]